MTDSHAEQADDTRSNAAYDSSGERTILERLEFAHDIMCMRFGDETGALGGGPGFPEVRETLETVVREFRTNSVVEFDTAEVQALLNLTDIFQERDGLTEHEQSAREKLLDEMERVLREMEPEGGQ